MVRKRSLERVPRWERFLRRARAFLLWWWKVYLALVVVAAAGDLVNATKQ